MFRDGQLPKENLVDHVSYLSDLVYDSNQPKGQEAIAHIPTLRSLNAMSLGPRSLNMAESFEPDRKDDVVARIEAFLKSSGMHDLSSAFLLIPDLKTPLQDISFAQKKQAQARPQAREDIETVVRASALFTDVKGVPLLSKPADCPIVMFEGVSDLKKPVIGMVHAGRVETEAGLIEVAAHHMINVYGCNPDNVRVGITPGISMDDYYIRDDGKSPYINPERWRKNYEYRETQEGGRIHLNILGNVLKQLGDAGVMYRNITAHALNTYQMAQEVPPRAFSNRFATSNNKPERNGRFLVAMQI